MCELCGALRRIKDTAIFIYPAFFCLISSVALTYSAYSFLPSSDSKNAVISGSKTLARELYVQKCINLEEFNSDLLGIETLVVEDGFFFNCIVSSVEIRKLNEEELSKQVEKHQRSDGQYVFSGAFMPKEKITETIHDKYVVITVVIKHQVNASEDTVFELYPYNKSEDEYL